MARLIGKIILLLLCCAIAVVSVVNGVDRMASDEAMIPVLEHKTRDLLANKPNPKVLILGDSRAMNNVIPAVMEKEVGAGVLNLSYHGVDLITSFNLLREFGLLNRGLTLFISISPDWSYESTYSFFDAFIPNLSWSDKIRYCAYDEENCKMAINFYARYFVRKTLGFLHVNVMSTYDPKEQEGEDGYLPIESVWEPSRPAAVGDSRRPWFSRFLVTRAELEGPLRERFLSYSAGARWNVFRHALEKLSRSNSDVYLFVSPTAPIEKYRGDLEYASRVREEIRNYPNIHWLDYFNEGKYRGLSNDLFGDVSHFNRKGAEVFTRMLAHSMKM